MVEGSVSVDPRAGRMRFSCESKHVISHFLHALYFENSLAIQIGFFFFATFWAPSEYCRVLFKLMLRLKRDVRSNIIFRSIVL